jgi:cyanamide hydratase
MSNPIEKHGFTAVPRSLSKLIANHSTKTTSTPISIADIDLPNTPLATSIQAYAKANLPRKTYNHSMRVYYYGKTSSPPSLPLISPNPTLLGRAITALHFPLWTYSPETLLLTSLLHDIGTTPSNHTSTYLSFEFAGGYIALNLLKALQAEIAQAEAVCETIIRHQDLGETGMVSTLTAIVHFATVLDNAGLNGELVHKGTIESVVCAFPREGWTGCFGEVVKRECEVKPWSNTTRIEGFAEMVERNELMEPYDG